MWILGDVVMIITQSLKSEIFREVLGNVPQTINSYQVLHSLGLRGQTARRRGRMRFRV